jgi:hypothetical protein
MKAILPMGLRPVFRHRIRGTYLTRIRQLADQVTARFLYVAMLLFSIERSTGPMPNGV